MVLDAVNQIVVPYLVNLVMMQVHRAVDERVLRALETALETVDSWFHGNSRSSDASQESDVSQEGSPALDPKLMELWERTKDDGEDLLEEYEIEDWRWSQEPPQNKRQRLDLGGHRVNNPLNLSPTSEGNTQRGAGGINPQVQGRIISVGTGANINLGTQVIYKGLNDPDTVPRAFKSRRRNEFFTKISESCRRSRDSWLKNLDEGFLRLQLHEKALDTFKDDPSTFDLLRKYQLETSATSIVDPLLSHLVKDNKLKNLAVEESQTVEPTSLTSADRVSLAKSLPGSLSAKAVALVEALEGKCVDIFITALWAVAEESGLPLKKLDNKLERTLLHSYRKDLTSQVSSGVEPVSLLLKVVSLLYLQLCGKALQAPVRAISAVVSHLKNKLEDSAHKVLVEYHTATVILSALQSAATEDEEDCTSDRILSKRKFLEGLMPELKALVLNNKEFDGDDYHTPNLSWACTSQAYKSLHKLRLFHKKQ